MSGIDPTNDVFQGRLYIGEDKATFDNPTADFSLNAADFGQLDQHGHGTHIAGIIAELAPKARLHILKYYNPNASGEQNLTSTIKALEHAIELNVDIINYSSGGPEASARKSTIANKKDFDNISSW